jgi:hypothetical protein
MRPHEPTLVKIGGNGTAGRGDESDHPPQKFHFAAF